MATLDPILRGKYPAKAHCAKVASYLKTHVKRDTPATIYLKGQNTRMIEDNDEAQPFRQRRHFFYLSGCALPDAHLTYHIPTSTLTLFIPPLSPSSVIWSGLPLSPAEALEKYDIDACHPTTELEPHLTKHAADGTIAITRHDNPHPDFPNANINDLHPAINACRVTKSPYEIASIKHANAVSTAAHTAILKAVKHARSEAELEAVFTERCIALGCREQAYHGIFGSGENAATLHYQANNQRLEGRLNMLVDAAAEWECYCADVTRTMPLDGKFTIESENIYRIVEKMQEESFKLLRPGVAWEDVQMRAHEVAVEGLLSIGILKGTKAELLEKRISVAFFPHGLGHYLGMDTHDTGGNPNYEDKDTMFKYLRTRGTLPESSVITVEPGIYFCRFIIEPYLKDEKLKNHVDEAVLQKYWAVGGVRIEDDILITKDGYENLTTAPKGVEMMKIMDS